MSDIDALKQAATCETIHYDSADGKTSIHALVWMPGTVSGAPVPVGDDAADNNAAGQPTVCGIVQIIHGMVEHIERYDDFARFLCAHGFAVCANDHIGHGGSVESDDQLGVLPKNGGDIMVRDVHALRTIMGQRLGSDVPYLMFGHSMGSFILRAYLPRFGEGLAAAVVCGTGQQPVAVSKMGNLVARFLCATRGEAYRSSFMHGLADGAYSKKVENPRTDLDWINTDPAKVDEYIADPACGGVFSAGGYVSLTDLTAAVASKECAAGVPDGLPVLFISGALDPVGDNGEGPKAAACAMQQNSKANVSLKIYDGMRHEVLNEPGHAQVYDDVLEFFEQAIGKGGR